MTPLSRAPGQPPNPTPGSQESPEPAAKGCFAVRGGGYGAGSQQQGWGGETEEVAEGRQEAASRDNLLGGSRRASEAPKPLRLSQLS